jgi:uncharacterized protein (TIGR02453 family)
VATEFPHGAARFLGALRRNNRKEWFDKHRGEYETLVLEPAKEFLLELGEPLRKLRPRLRVDPRINYGVKRINRDVRFARDKRPYKDHQTLWWWEGDEKDSSPGYWFDLMPRSVILAVGLHMIEPKLLDRFREAVLDERRGKKLDTLIKGFEKNRYKLEGQTTKRVPRGYDAEHERARYLKHTGLYMWIETPLPRGSFSQHCLGHFRRLTPLQGWFVGIL